MMTPEFPYIQQPQAYYNYSRTEPDWLDIDRPRLETFTAQLDSSQPILVANCGWGREVEYLQSHPKRFTRVRGYDSDARLIQLGRKQYPQLPIYPISSLHAESIAPHTHQAVISPSIDHLTTPQFHSLLQNSHRILLPHGFVYFACRHPASYQAVITKTPTHTKNYHPGESESPDITKRFNNYYMHSAATATVLPITKREQSVE